jgi:hypothetical protein
MNSRRGSTPLSRYAPDKYRAIIIACVEGNAPAEWFAKKIGVARSTVRFIAERERRREGFRGIYND